MEFRAKMWHVYLIRTKMGHLYTGVTQDVKRRFKEHQKEGRKGAKYLKGKKYIFNFITFKRINILLNGRR